MKRFHTIDPYLVSTIPLSLLGSMIPSFLWNNHSNCKSVWVQQAITELAFVSFTYVSHSTFIYLDEERAGMLYLSHNSILFLSKILNWS